MLMLLTCSCCWHVHVVVVVWSRVRSTSIWQRIWNKRSSSSCYCCWLVSPTWVCSMGNNYSIIIIIIHGVIHHHNSNHEIILLTSRALSAVHIMMLMLLPRIPYLIKKIRSYTAVAIGVVVAYPTPTLYQYLLLLLLQLAVLHTLSYHTIINLL